MFRFHLPPDKWDGQPALAGDEARHGSQVLRLKSGDSLVVFDGKGRAAAARVLEVFRDRIPLEIREILPCAAPSPSITLAQAIPKGKNMDLIVQKAVELGVTAIQPLITRHTIVQPGDGKSGKWRRIALEACKQCGQNTLPEIADPITFDRWIGAQTLSPELKLIASLVPGSQSLRGTLRDHVGFLRATVLVGPEGDFSGAETAAALAAGFLPISLGSIILRVETAALFCLSALRYELG